MGKLSKNPVKTTESENTALKPLVSVDGNPAFDEPWQAQALAIADTLVQQQLFSANAWSEALGKALEQANAKGDEDTQLTYYRCVVTALEKLVADYSEIDPQAMIDKRNDWEQAYLSTPHGQPVKLK